MKKFLVVALLAATIATPALAGFAPVQPIRNLEEQNVYVDMSGTGGQRTATYVANSPTHVYDNYQNSTNTTIGFGPDDILFSWGNMDSGNTQNFGASFNRLTLAPGATNITQIHLRVVTGLQQGVGTQIPLQLGFYSSTGPDSSPAIGSFLQTGSGSAFFSVNIPNPAAASLFNLTITLPAITAPAGGDIWLGYASPNHVNFRGGLERTANGGTTPLFPLGKPTGSQVHGNPGDQVPASMYIGSGSGIFATNSGGSLLSPTSANVFITAFQNAAMQPTRYLNNWHLALGGAPEPTTALLLGLGGLLVLRRRKAA